MALCASVQKAKSSAADGCKCTGASSAMLTDDDDDDEDDDDDDDDNDARADVANASASVPLVALASAAARSVNEAKAAGKAARGRREVAAEDADDDGRAS